MIYEHAEYEDGSPVSTKTLNPANKWCPKHWAFMMCGDTVIFEEEHAELIGIAPAMAVVGQTEVEYEVFLKFADGDMEWFPMSDIRGLVLTKKIPYIRRVNPYWAWLGQETGD